MLRLIVNALVRLGARQVEEKVGAAKTARTWSALFLLLGIVFTGVWLAFFRSEIVFEKTDVTVVEVAPLRGSPTLLVKTADHGEFRLVDDIYRGPHARGHDWARDELADRLADNPEAEIWVIPGRRRIQGLRAGEIFLSPDIGRRVEADQRRYAPFLPLLFFVLAVGAWFEGIKEERSNGAPRTNSQESDGRKSASDIRPS